MPEFIADTESFSFGTVNVQLRVPVPNGVRISTEWGKTTEEPAPYWTKLWPSAMALCDFIAANPHFVARRKELELGAGLGLPGILAARFAREVTISDYVPEAVALMQSSIRLNRLTNVYCRLLNWNMLPADLTADVLLLSDINYEPSAFEILYQMLQGFLSRRTTILLATPQRLMARPFIDQLLPYCVTQEEQLVTLHGAQAFISIFVLTLNRDVIT